MLEEPDSHPYRIGASPFAHTCKNVQAQGVPLLTNSQHSKWHNKQSRLIISPQCLVIGINICHMHYQQCGHAY